MPSERTIDEILPEEANFNLETALFDLLRFLSLKNKTSAREKLLHLLEESLQEIYPVSLMLINERVSAGKNVSSSSLYGLKEKQFKVALMLRTWFFAEDLNKKSLAQDEILPLLNSAVKAQTKAALSRFTLSSAALHEARQRFLGKKRDPEYDASLRQGDLIGEPPLNTGRKVHTRNKD